MNLRLPARWTTVVLGSLLVASIVFGTAWRWQQLSARPLHADEAVQAWQTWQLLRGEGYRYDPVDRHGPSLYYGAAALEWLRGGDSTTFNEARARGFVALAGVATLLLIAAAAARSFGLATAVIATALLAVAPLAVLYHTYFVQEAWLALFTWALLFCGLRWWARPSWPWALGAGALVGLMQSTKETAVLHYAALALAWFAASRGRTTATRAEGATAPDRATRPGQLLGACGVAALIYALFYTSFGQHPRGVVDGALTYLHQWQRSGDADHTQPMWHYLRLLAPHRAGGLTWGEPALLAFALGGAVVALRPSAVPAARGVAGLTLALLLIYSLIPYKTPWLLLTPVIGLCLLAALGITALGRVRRWGPLIAFACAVLAVTQLAGRTRFALERLPGDARNPYFYQQTPRGFLALVRRVQELQAAAGRELTLAVVSPDYAWPVPWYLRHASTTGYFTTAPEQPDAFDALIWDTQVPTPPEWPAGAIVELHGLRPNVLLYLVIRPELWQQWEAAR